MEFGNESILDLAQLVGRRLVNLHCPACGEPLKIKSFSVSADATGETKHYTIMAKVLPCPCTPITVTVRKETT